jgi:hypothetical protein
LNNEFIWKILKQTLNSLSISHKDKIYFVPYIISLLIIIRSSNIIQESVNNDSSVPSNYQSIQEYFNFVFYESFMFYPIDSNQFISVNFQNQLIP